MIWYNNLYISDNISADASHIKRYVEWGRFRRTRGWYLVTLSDFLDGQLEIIPVGERKHPAFRPGGRYVVGVARGYRRALEMVRQITEDVWHIQGDCRLKDYFLTRFEESNRDKECRDVCS